jgi:hypothetical protein
MEGGFVVVVVVKVEVEVEEMLWRVKSTIVFDGGGLGCQVNKRGSRTLCTKSRHNDCDEMEDGDETRT